MAVTQRLRGMARTVFHAIPEGHRPTVRAVAEAGILRAQALAKRRRIFRGRRVEFLDYEIAHLEPYPFLSPGRQEVLYEAHFSTISPGTERAVLLGLPGTPRSFPIPPGYSSAGVVLEAGDESGFRVGERVAGRVKHASHDSLRPDALFPVPDGVSLEDASMIELGIITLQAIRKAAIQPGERVAVVGQGILGQLSNRLARLLGASRVVALATGRGRERVAVAPGGAHDYVALSDAGADPASIEADVVVEATGTPAAVETAMRCARRGGRVSLLGSSRGIGRDVDVWSLAQRRRLDLVGAHIMAVPERDPSAGLFTYRQEGRVFLDLLASGRLDVSGLITSRPRPEDCNAVYERLAGGGGSDVGIVFQWKEGPATARG